MTSLAKTIFTSAPVSHSVRKIFPLMRISTIAVCVLAAAFLSTGCAGPERKLGRGLTNFAEVTRLGELRHSMEQSAIWDSPEQGMSNGFITGVSKTVKRTAVGLYEVVTFPIPSYDPVLEPEWGQYPDNYKPNLVSDSTFHPDASLGFAGGDVAPFLPGSRFKVFDY